MIDFVEANSRFADAAEHPAEAEPVGLFDRPADGRRAGAPERVAREPIIGSTAHRFPLVDCATLASTTYETRFLVDGLLVAGQPTVMAGSKKTLKSLLAVDVAVSVATGADCFGQFSVPRAESVVYMTGEGGLGLAQDYAGRVARARGFDLGDVAGLWFCDRLPQLASATDLGHLRNILRAQRPGLLVVDCAYLCMPGTEAGNVMKQGEILSGFHRVCLENDVTPLLLHHTKSTVANPHVPAELSDIAWAGFSEFASGWLLLSRRERYDPDRPGEHRLWVNVGARVGLSSLWALDVTEGQRTDPGGRRWEVSIGRARDARADAESRREEAKRRKAEEAEERHREKLLRALARCPEGETESRLRDLAGLKSGECKTALASLLDTSEVVPCGVMKANRKTPYEGYKLAECG